MPSLISVGAQHQVLVPVHLLSYMPVTLYFFKCLPVSTKVDDYDVYFTFHKLFQNQVKTKGPTFMELTTCMTYISCFTNFQNYLHPSSEQLHIFFFAKFLYQKWVKVSVVMHLKKHT